MIKFKNGTFEGFESDGPVPVTLVASGPASFPYTVVVIPTDSIPASALKGIDYDDTPINATFLPGITEVDIRIPLIEDSIEESLEMFTLMLEVDVNGVFPTIPLFAQVHIKEKLSMYLKLHNSVNTILIIYVYVCVCVHVHVCMYACVYACMHACMYVYYVYNIYAYVRTY